jgi:uncharacterized membrane protein YfcA
VIAILIVFVAAAIQGIVGIGFAIVTVPLLSLIDPVMAPVPTLLVTLPLTITMFWSERHAVDVGGIWWIIAGRVPGAAIGVWLLTIASDRALDVMIALFVLSGVAALGAGVTLRHDPPTKFGVGVFSGTSALVSSIGGPPVALLYKDQQGPAIRASTSAVFTFGISITIVSRILAGEMRATDVQLAAVFFPALVLGYIVSRRLRHRIDAMWIRRAILVLSALAAVSLLVRAAIA